jgi:hypothetical protein
MDRKHVSLRVREVGIKFRKSNRAYLEYKMAYRKWSAASAKRDPKASELELQREICARKASKEYYELGRMLKVLAWWWTFGE